MLIIKKCRKCGKYFKIPHWRKEAKYCNFECYNNRERYLVKCSYCNKKFIIIGNRYKKSKNKRFFCCIKHQSLYNIKENNPNYNNHKLSKFNNPNYRGGQFKKCLNCNNIIWVKPCKLNKNNFCSRNCKFKYEVGKNAGGYRNGKSKEPYTLEFNKILKKQIKKRDNYQCQLCGINEKNYFQALSIHHIGYDKNNNKENNLISLCRDCHRKTNSNRKYWIKYFKEVINNEYKFSKFLGFIYDKSGFVKKSLLSEMIESKDGYIGETPNVKTRTIPREVVIDPVTTTRHPSRKEDDIV